MAKQAYVGNGPALTDEEQRAGPRGSPTPRAAWRKCGVKSTADNQGYRMLSRAKVTVMTDGFSISTDVLRAHKAETEIILRLGAIANALLTLGRRTPEPHHTTPLARQDALQFTMMAASYLYNAVKQLETRHDGLWWSLAEDGVQSGRPFPPFMSLEEVRALLTLGSSYSRIAGRIRDQYAFHVDRTPLAQFIDASDLSTVSLMSFEGDSVGHVFFLASYTALISAIPELGSSTFADQKRRHYRASHAQASTCGQFRRTATGLIASSAIMATGAWKCRSAESTNFSTDGAGRLVRWRSRKPTIRKPRTSVSGGVVIG
jgi:hypothetical protein